MIKMILRLFNCLIINNIKFLIIKIFHYHHFKFKFLNLISPFTSIDIRNNGKIEFGNMVKILNGNMLAVRENGNLRIDDEVYINRNCQIVCYKNIFIGKNVKIGPNVVIMDNDHSYGSNGIIKGKFKSSDIEIGENVWIGANTIILRGSKIGNNTIIGAGSLIKGNIPSNSVVVQKRENTIIKIKEGEQSGKGT